MLAHMWRFLVALCDLHTWWRLVCRQPIVDVVCISNMRDVEDRKRFLGNWTPPEGHFNGPRYWFTNLIIRVRAIDAVFPLLRGSLDGSPGVTKREEANARTKAKGLFEHAAEWAQRNGACVVLLAAATKRFYGGSTAEALKRKFPRMLFTIGDNGTALLLYMEVGRALVAAGLSKADAKICVIGPTGFLGSVIVSRLFKEGHNVVGLSSSNERVSRSLVPTFTRFEDVGKVDLVVSCTHAVHLRLTRERIGTLRKGGRKLIVIDVSEPSSLTYDEYGRSSDIVVRQDAGNAFSPKLAYVLGPISYLLLRSSRGITFGCFAEAIVLAAELKAGGAEVRNRDWFVVSEENMAIVEKLFEKHGFSVPSPRCFGKPIKSFST